MPQAPSRSEIEARLRELVPDVTEPLLSTFRPSIRLRLRSKGPVALGQSHFCGPAHVPADFEWPNCAAFYRRWMHPGRSLGEMFGRLRDRLVGRAPDSTPAPVPERLPLTLMAQIRLADLPADMDDNLPRDGQLLFFADIRDEPLLGGVGEPSDRWRVVWIADGPLVEMPSPLTCATPARAVESVTEWLVDDQLAWELGEEDEGEAVTEYQAGWIESGGGVHRLSGYGQSIQDDVAYDAESMFRSDPKYESVEGREREVREQWRLLLQLDSDPELGWEWGDAGRLYFMILADDLVARRFERVQFVSQCY